METPDRADRRTVLKGVGAAAVTALLAGCADEEAPEDDPDEGPDEEPDEGPDDDPGEEPDDEEWADVDEILLEGRFEAWTGVEPGIIEGEENPTLVLSEGQQYAIEWENADGDMHNIALRDEDEEVIDGYETEIIEEEGETQTLEFEATAEMAEYVCVPHQTTMVGDIEIAEDGGG